MTGRSILMGQQRRVEGGVMIYETATWRRSSFTLFRERRGDSVGTCQRLKKYHPLTGNTGPALLGLTLKALHLVTSTDM